MNEEEQPIEIPLTALSDEALLGVIDDYVLREGTEYGAAEVSLERKRQQLLDQLHAGSAVVMFDQTTETCTIVVRERSRSGLA
jgi:uncharacterized protein YheU (UPF0270 family)